MSQREEQGGIEDDTILFYVYSSHRESTFAPKNGDILYYRYILLL